MTRLSVPLDRSVGPMAIAFDADDSTVRGVPLAGGAVRIFGSGLPIAGTRVASPGGCALRDENLKRRDDGCSYRYKN